MSRFIWFTSLGIIRKAIWEGLLKFWITSSTCPFSSLLWPRHVHLMLVYLTVIPAWQMHHVFTDRMMMTTLPQVCLARRSQDTMLQWHCLMTYHSPLNRYVFTKGTVKYSFKHWGKEMLIAGFVFWKYRMFAKSYVFKMLLEACYCFSLEFHRVIKIGTCACRANMNIETELLIFLKIEIRYFIKLK